IAAIKKQNNQPTTALVKSPAVSVVGSKSESNSKSLPAGSSKLSSSANSNTIANQNSSNAISSTRKTTYSVLHQRKSSINHHFLSGIKKSNQNAGSVVAKSANSQS